MSIWNQRWQRGFAVLALLVALVALGSVLLYLSGNGSHVGLRRQMTTLQELSRRGLPEMADALKAVGRVGRGTIPGDSPPSRNGSFSTAQRQGV